MTPDQAKQLIDVIGMLPFALVPYGLCFIWGVVSICHAINRLKDGRK